MKSNVFRFVIIVLTVWILTACEAQATEAPASVPTETSVPAISSPTGTQAPTNPPADTATVVPTDTAQPQATETPTIAPATSASTISFANDIAPLLQSRCGNCHGGNQTQEGLNLLSYDAVMSGSQNGPVITPGDATNSMLVDLVVTQKMPKKGPKLTPDQVQLITDWVNQGALNN